MRRVSITSILGRKKSPRSVEERPDHARLVVEQLPHIERLCRKASASPGNVRSEADIDNEADLLLTEVLDHLKADDYKVLRDFRGDSKLTTYLTTVISNLIVDVVRKRKGRSRSGERAMELGPLAVRLHELVHVRGYTLADAHGHMVLSHGITEGEDDLRNLLTRIRGRDDVTYSGTADWPYHGREVLIDDEVELIVPDPAIGAEQIMINSEREQRKKEAMSAMLDVLSGEERYMLRLRFPSDDNERPHSVREIAALLGQTEKSVDSRLRRTLLRCREMLLQRGFSLDDLISARE